MENEQQFIERRMREESAERFRKEYAQYALQCQAQEKRDAEAAKTQTDRLERERMELASRNARTSNADTETCSVCGEQRVPVSALCHPIYGTNDRCIRKPRAAKAAGQITQDAWDMLTDVQKETGYILEYGNAQHNTTIYPAPLPGTVNPLAR